MVCIWFVCCMCVLYVNSVHVMYMFIYVLCLWYMNGVGGICGMCEACLVYVW